jgi:hypothetical protein
MTTGTWGMDNEYPPFFIRPKNKINPVSCFKGKKIRVGRSEKTFYFIFLNFIFIQIQEQSKP